MKELDRLSQRGVKIKELLPEKGKSYGHIINLIDIESIHATVFDKHHKHYLYTNYLK